jgi:hypothetical protein
MDVVEEMMMMLRRLAATAASTVVGDAAARWRRRDRRRVRRTLLPRGSWKWRDRRGGHEITRGRWRRKLRRWNVCRRTRGR